MDVTFAQRVEKERQEMAQEEVEWRTKSADGFEVERERLHRQMLSSVSHDLKTPLASVVGSLEAYKRMKSRLSEDKKDELILTALREAYRLDSFITNILDMAKLENGMVNTRFEPVSITHTIQDALLKMTRQLANSKVEVKPELGGEAMLVNTDMALLHLCLAHLLDNAVKYGGDPNQITIHYGYIPSGGYISVQDNGPGIPERDMESIFCKYRRLQESDYRNAGTGLGLAISRKAMELCNGTISAANHPSGGAILTLEFGAAQHRQ